MKTNQNRSYKNVKVKTRFQVINALWQEQTKNDEKNHQKSVRLLYYDITDGRHLYFWNWAQQNPDMQDPTWNACSCEGERPSNLFNALQNIVKIKWFDCYLFSDLYCFIFLAVILSDQMIRPTFLDNWVNTSIQSVSNWSRSKKTTCSADFETWRNDCNKNYLISWFQRLSLITLGYRPHSPSPNF